MLYVPLLTVNLISASRLATDADCSLVLYQDICVFQDCTTKSPIGRGKLHKEVFPFQSMPTSSVATITDSVSYELWHYLMGHHFHSASSAPFIY